MYHGSLFMNHECAQSVCNWDPGQGVDAEKWRVGFVDSLYETINLVLEARVVRDQGSRN
jgi:uncharacterized protein CbrC (UPF0167 family)